MLRRISHPEIVVAEALGERIAAAAAKQARRLALALQRGKTAAADRPGCTLRPGAGTPLWNELREEIRVHLKVRGRQAQLARLIGLPRQRINSFVTGGGQMPDAERTLQLLAWLSAVRHHDGRLPGSPGRSRRTLGDLRP